MNRTIIPIGAVAAAALALPSLLHAERNVIPPEVAWDQRVASDILYEMELRDEANENYLSHNQVRRIASARAVQRARAENEVAAYERFRFDQRLALQEASAPRTYIMNRTTSGGEEEIRPSSLRSGGLPVGYHSPVHIRTTYEGFAPRSSSRTYISTPPASTTERLQRYPARFWAKQSRERGADRLRDEALAREAIEASAISGNSGALRASPISERPGYVTNPDTGNVIDVRGFRSGDMVRDPYSGETFRVP